MFTGIEPNQVILLLILAGSVVLFFTEWIRIDLSAVLIILMLGLTGLLELEEALSGFSREPAILLASVFVWNGGMYHTGLSARLGNIIKGVICTESNDDYCSVECLENGMSDAISGTCEICGSETVIITTLLRDAIPVFCCSECYSDNKINECLDISGDFIPCDCGCGFVKPYVDKNGDYHNDRCRICGYDYDYPQPQKNQIVRPEMRAMFDFEPRIMMTEQIDGYRDLNYRSITTDDYVLVVRN